MRDRYIDRIDMSVDIQRDRWISLSLVSFSTARNRDVYVKQARKIF